MDRPAAEAVSPTSLGDVTVLEAASEMSPANASSSRLQRLGQEPEEQSPPPCQLRVLRLV